MKNRYLILLLIVSGLSQACSDWLDVRPRSEMKEDDLFAVEEGFKNALNGVYIQLAEGTLYGKNLTMYLPELLENHYTTPTDNTSAEYAISQFDYDQSDVETLIGQIWKSYYTAIVHLNNILENLENSMVHFSYGNDRLIEGEALGLRAFLHLDILRWFTASPDLLQPSDLTIPYAEEMSKDPNRFRRRTYEEVITCIRRDLDAAEKLLEEDPIVILPEGEKPEDDWQYYRQVRFNYYAVLAAKARFYLWLGGEENRQKAGEYARKVADAAYEDGTLKFPLADEVYMNGDDKNLVMSCEHIWGVQNPDHQSLVDPFFKEEGKNFRATQQIALLNNNYELSVHPNDIRMKLKRYWEEVTGTTGKRITYYYKYTGSDAYSALNLVPVIRVAEMYLICAETLSGTEGKKYWTDYRVARNMNNSIDEELNSPEKMKSQLEKEYHKEFYGEGQAFFWHKRWNATESSWKTPKVWTFYPEAYVLQIPDNQMQFE